MQSDDGAVVAQLTVTYRWSDWRDAQIWWIQNVYVRPDFRRQGLFKQLYLHAKTQSSLAGACGIRLYADNSNERAHKAVRLQLASPASQHLVYF
jgi:ribosomal protein S18 acetylase RimI-like enzyme